MSEIAYKTSGAPIAVPVDEEGRPQCMCGCAEPMVETAPGRWECALQRRALDLVVSKLVPALEKLL